ncbi:MAG TPA: futalosine hydrolase [Chitinophagaceae bacterium]|nr:futalosine hydrolase [Chitinophagaceae bacterium]
MSVLVAAPTIAEIRPLVRYARRSALNIPVDIVVTGVGSISTTYTLLRQLLLKTPSLMIQAGIAGSFSKEIALGTVVAVASDTPADLGVIEAGKWRTVFDLGLESPNQFPYSGGWLKNRGAWLRRCGLSTVKAITLNQVSTERNTVGALKGRFRPAIETLEGAAFHYVALRERIPFLQLRAVSNFVGERNKRHWKLAGAINNLNRELIRILETL